ncbi:MAG: SseB family protein [Microbacteriaceae bacterium]
MVEQSVLTDSAGRPWAGRRFAPGAFSGDDGSAPAALIQAIRRFRGEGSGTPATTEAEVVDAFRTSRLLIPLVARREDGAGQHGADGHGDAGDRSAELSIVTVAGPDGRNVLPVFASVASMAHWNPKARPVPADGIRVALAAVSEQTDLVLLDPGSPTEYVIRRPALSAIAQSLPWTPSYLDAGVLAEFVSAAEQEPAVVGVMLAAGDAQGRLAGPELLVDLRLTAGLDQAALDGLLDRMQRRWSTSQIIAARVDSLTVRLSRAA